MKVVLASASPRRRELVKYIDGDAVICPSGVEEVCTKRIPPKRLPRYFSELKARDVAKKYPDCLVIGCDTAVFLQKEMLCKPKDADSAERMLSSLSGRWHKVISGCTVIYKNKVRSFSVCTKVRFRELTKEDIARYIATGSPMDKAGAYGIQDCDFAVKIKGDYLNVVGFPVTRIYKEIIKISRLFS